MNEAYELKTGETHIEVHKFFPGAVVAVAIAAVVLQVSIPVHMRNFVVIDLPLLVTVYFGLSRRNPSTGLLLGTGIGLFQDALSGPTIPLGYYGIAKTCIGYAASSIGGKLDTEHPVARFSLILFFFVLQQAILVVIRRVLLAQPEPWFTTHLAIAAGVNALVGVPLFILLDKLRR